MVDTKDDTRIENARVQYNNDPRNGFPSQDNIAFTEAIKDNMPTALSEAQKDTCVENEQDLKPQYWLDRHGNECVIWYSVPSEGNAITTPSVENTTEKKYLLSDDDLWALRHELFPKDKWTANFFLIRNFCIKNCLSHTTGGELKPSEQSNNPKFTAYAIGVCDNIDQLRQLGKVEEDYVFPLCYCIGKSTLENRTATVEALTWESSNQKLEKEAGTWGVDRESIRNSLDNNIIEKWE